MITYCSYLYLSPKKSTYQSNLCQMVGDGWCIKAVHEWWCHWWPELKTEINKNVVPSKCFECLQETCMRNASAYSVLSRDTQSKPLSLERNFKSVNSCLLTTSSLYYTGLCKSGKMPVCEEQHLLPLGFSFCWARAHSYGSHKCFGCRCACF